MILQASSCSGSKITSIEPDIQCQGSLKNNLLQILEYVGKALFTSNSEGKQQEMSTSSQDSQSPVGKKAGQIPYMTDTLGDTTQPMEPGQSHKLRKDKG